MVNGIEYTRIHLKSTHTHIIARPHGHTIGKSGKINKIAFFINVILNFFVFFSFLLLLLVFLLLFSLSHSIILSLSSIRQKKNNNNNKTRISGHLWINDFVYLWICKSVTWIFIIICVDVTVTIVAKKYL